MFSPQDMYKLVEHFTSIPPCIFTSNLILRIILVLTILRKTLRVRNLNFVGIFCFHSEDYNDNLGGIGV